MMAPVPSPASPAGTPDDRSELPNVRLEMRTDSGRTVGYEVGGSEFLIGSAPGCDLRIPLPSLPPVAAQVSRKSDGIRVRRVAPGLPISLNGSPLPTNIPTAVRHGDRLTLGEVELVFALSIAGLVAPRLVPIDEMAPPPLPRVKDDDREAELAAREARLAERERLAEEAAEELKADRVIWYRRREEMEQEFEARRSEWLAQVPEIASKGAAVAEQENELERTREEIHRLRESARSTQIHLQEERRLFDLERTRAEKESADRFAANQQEFERQRLAIAADRNVLERSRETFEAEQIAGGERLQLWEATLATRDVELADRENVIRIERSNLDSDRKQYTEDLVRLERKQAIVAEQERDLKSRETDVQIRTGQLQRDAFELDERSRQIAIEQDRVQIEAERVERQRVELEERAAALSQRAIEFEAHQATLNAMRSRLERTRMDVEREAAMLAQARVREEEAQSQLHQRIRDAEQLRAELTTVQENTAQERHRLEERDSLLNAGLEEIRQQREAILAEDARVREKAQELDQRVADFAEQAGALKGRLTLALDLQARLEADRAALRQREITLAQSEEARQALQEQIRRRAEELSTRSRSLDDLARNLATQKAALEQAVGEIEKKRMASDEEAIRVRAEAEARAAEVARRAESFAEKEASLARQVSRLQDVGRAVAAERKALAEARASWETDRAAFLAADLKAREEADAFRDQVAKEIDALRARIPELDEQSKAALDRLNAARGMFRGHLTELHDYAKQTREDLEVVRAMLRDESQRLRSQEQELNNTRAEHRLAVTAFRQQLIEWQGRVNEIKRSLSQSESRLEAKEAAVNEAARQIDSNTQQLAQQTEQLRREREAVAWKRTSVERHLSDMREWYRKKLRDLANTEGTMRITETSEEVPARPRLAATSNDTALASIDFEELEPGDLQLGELLLSAELVEASTMTDLWNEAKRQRRTLRQVLLASGAITLYQLALIEAGNLDGLVLGRFRVVDRVRTSPRENVYRVFDPTRADSDSNGLYLLRHLSEAEAQDAVHPDEFRQRFAAARDASHPNLAEVLEVLDLQGRPAVVQEWLTGLPGAELPPHAANPGCWIRLVTMAAEALNAAHRAGLVHGRLTSDSLVLTPEGLLKLTGYADPHWLDGSASATSEPTIAMDLRDLGQIAFAWSQLAAKKRGKPFPDSLAAIIRRLDADPAPPMEDTVPADPPYQSAAELVADLKHLAKETTFSEDAWNKLLHHTAENAPQSPAALRRSA